MNITENWLNELDSMTETDRRITLGSPEWKELIDFARQGLRLQQKQSELSNHVLITDEQHEKFLTLQNSLEAAKRDTGRLIDWDALVTVALAVRDAHHCLKNIKDYGALHSNSDWAKCQPVLESLVKAQEALTKMSSDHAINVERKEKL